VKVKGQRTSQHIGSGMALLAHAVMNLFVALISRFFV